MRESLRADRIDAGLADEERVVRKIVQPAPDEAAEELGDGTGNSGGEWVWQLGGKLLASLHVQLRVLQARLLMSSMDTYFRIRCWLLDIRPHSQRDLG